MKFWLWTPPKGHEDQPVFDWYLEQVAINLLAWVASRSIDRLDDQTYDRMAALFEAGAKTERDAETEMERSVDG